MAAITSLIIPSAFDERQTHPKNGMSEAAMDQMITDSPSLSSSGVESCSQPPSPPSTGANTPTLRIAPCPERLLPIYPPFNYGTVEHKSIFRSSYPLERNIDFIMRLNIKTVLCLVDTEPSELYSDWVAAKRVKRLRVDIAANKEGVVKTTTESLYEAVLYVMTKANHPIYVHCNQGKHRTGCVMACVRKVQGTMTMEDIAEEYVAYAGKKARPGDLDLIRSFDTKAFAEFVTACNHIVEPYTGFFIRRRVDSGSFVHDLNIPSDADPKSDMSLDTVSQISEHSDMYTLTDQISKHATSQSSAISQEAVDRVRLIMEDEPVN